jgi:transcriptional regulator with XRE-family HTH domain
MPKRKTTTKARRTPGAAAGRVIRRLREETGIAQEAMAVEIGIIRTYMGLLEREQANPTLSSLARVLKRFGLTWQEFGRLLDREIRKHR